MALETFNQNEFPETLLVIEDKLREAYIPFLGPSVAIYGGAARSGMLEATTDLPSRPIRDIDIAKIGEGISDIDFRRLNHRLNPGEQSYDEAPIVEFPSVHRLMRDRTDFTINRSVITMGRAPLLRTTTEALQASELRIIKPTPERIALAKTLEADHLQDPDSRSKRELFSNHQTGMPARAAYYVAVFEAAGVEFEYDMLDLPAASSPEETNSFFLGLMVNRALQQDEIERGAGDITATLNLFNLYDEMGLTEDTAPASADDIVAYCESVNDEHPELQFSGSKIAEVVRHSAQDPARRAA